MRTLITLIAILVSGSASANNYGKFKLEFSDFAGVEYSSEFLLNSKHKVKEIESSDNLQIFATRLGQNKILTVLGPGDEDFVKVRFHLENNLLVSSCGVFIDAKNEYLDYLATSSIKMYRWSKAKGQYLLLEPSNSQKDSAICMSEIIQGYEDLEN